MLIPYALPSHHSKVTFDMPVCCGAKSVRGDRMASLRSMWKKGRCKRCFPFRPHPLSDLAVGGFHRVDGVDLQSPHVESRSVLVDHISAAVSEQTNAHASLVSHRFRVGPVDPLGHSHLRLAPLCQSRNEIYRCKCSAREAQLSIIRASSRRPNASLSIRIPKSSKCRLRSSTSTCRCSFSFLSTAESTSKSNDATRTLSCNATPTDRRTRPTPASCVPPDATRACRQARLSTTARSNYVRRHSISPTTTRSSRPNVCQIITRPSRPCESTTRRRKADRCSLRSWQRNGVRPCNTRTPSRRRTTAIR